MRLLLLPILLFLTTASAQQPRFFRHFTEKDGLSDPTVQAILRDRRGWLWVGTPRGLNRWDGQKFEQFFPDAARPERTVSSEFINDIKEDGDGFVWIATRDGLNRFDPRTRTFRVWRNTGRDDGSLPNSLVSSILIDKNNGLWLCCDNRDLCFFDPKTEQFRTFGWKKFAAETAPAFAAKDYKTIYYLTEKSPAELWLHTNLGIFGFEKTTGSFRFYPITNLEKLPAARPGACPDMHYFGSWDSDVLRFDGCSSQFSRAKLPIPASEKGGRRQVAGVFPMGENFWVLAHKGLFLLDPKLEKIEAVVPSRENGFSVPTGSLTKAYKEPDGTVWLGGERGLWQFDPRLQHFDYIAVVSDKSDALVNTFCRVLDSPTDGRRYLLDLYGSRLLFSDAAARTTSQQLPGQSAMLFQTRDGQIWTSGGSQIFKLNQANGQLIEVSVPQNLLAAEPPRIFSDMAEDAAGNLWFGSDAGIFIFSPGKNEWQRLPDFSKKGQTQQDTGFFGKSITSILADPARHSVWVGTDEYGLFRFDEKTGAWQLFQHDPKRPDSFSAFMVRGLCLDGAGNLWAATDPGGLCRFDGDRFLTLGTEAGLPSNQVCGVVRDRAGNLWAGTTRGLVWVDFQRLRVRSFNRNDGLENDFLDLPLSVSAVSGEVFAGSKFGYTAFQPDSLLFEKAERRILLTGFKIFDREVNLKAIEASNPETINLAWRENFFSIEFVAADFSRPEKNEYSYRLIGFDKDWNFCGPRTSAAYTNVPPGDYFLEIRSGREGRWNEPGLRLPIRISPPFWQTWWFRLLALAAVFGLFFGIYKSKIARVRREEQLKTEFNRRLAQVEMSALRAQMNPHFVFNCLNSINRFILVNEPDAASGYLTKFSRLIRLILDNSRTDAVPLDKELEALKLYIEMEAMRFDGRFDFDISVAPDIQTEHIEVPPLLIQPFVENAIWHGLMHKKGRGRLKIDIFRAKNALCIAVEDDGIGRERARELKSKSATEHKSHGMQVTSERLEIIRNLYGVEAGVEVFDLENAAGEATGTRVLIRLSD